MQVTQRAASATQSLHGQIRARMTKKKHSWMVGVFAFLSTVVFGITAFYTTRYVGGALVEFFKQLASLQIFWLVGTVASGVIASVLWLATFYRSVPWTAGPGQPSN